MDRKQKKEHSYSLGVEFWRVSFGGVVDSKTKRFVIILLFS